jgi:hypothetical protein
MREGTDGHIIGSRRKGSRHDGEMQKRKRIDPNGK